MTTAFETYTRAVLPFRLEGTPGSYSTRPASPGWLEPVLRRAARGGHCVLLGAGRGEAALELAARLPEGMGLTVCELYPDHAVRQGLPLLVEGSPVSLAWLLFSVGLYRGSAFCVLNPEIDDPQARTRFQAVQKLHAAFTELELPGDTGGEPFTVAAILHPEEPGLDGPDGFFASLPRDARECVVVWDGATPPASPPPCPIPVRHLAHPLEGDFAAQRNRMLDACPDGWVLSLDADERLEPVLAGLLPRLTAARGVNAFAFPRLTICPGGVRVGWGLWPDLQVRLFRKRPGVRFVRPVHERLEGLAGPTGLTVGAHIRHLSGLLKQERELAGKHALFDKAAGREGLHRLNVEYPLLPEEFFRSLAPEPVAGAWPPTVRFAPLGVDLRGEAG